MKWAAKVMRDQHVKERLLEFIDQSLSAPERQLVGEHLLHCEACRREHDALKLGCRLASALERRDAPETLWQRVEYALDRPSETVISTPPSVPFFNFTRVVALACAVLVVGVFSALVYRALFTRTVPQIARQHQTVPAQVVPAASDSVAPQASPANVAIAGSTPAPAIEPPPTEQAPVAAEPHWQVETLAGSPTINASPSSDKLTVGDELVTDANSRAKVEVADIGMR